MTANDCRKPRVKSESRILNVKSGRVKAEIYMHRDEPSVDVGHTKEFSLERLHWLTRSIFEDYFKLVSNNFGRLRDIADVSTPIAHAI